MNVELQGAEAPPYVTLSIHHSTVSIKYVGA